jgi:hypothetical protein
MSPQHRLKHTYQGKQKVTNGNKGNKTYRKYKVSTKKKYKASTSTKGEAEDCRDARGGV